MVSPEDFDDYDWGELPADAKSAFETLGYTEALWKADKEPPSFECDFAELSSAQQAAAKAVGYTEATWDEE